MAAASIRTFVCGKGNSRSFEKTGNRTIGELANTDVEILKHHLKKQGESIWNFGQGRDASLVEGTVQENKGIWEQYPPLL